MVLVSCNENQKERVMSKVNVELNQKLMIKNYSLKFNLTDDFHEQNAVLREKIIGDHISVKKSRILFRQKPIRYFLDEKNEISIVISEIILDEGKSNDIFNDYAKIISKKFNLELKPMEFLISDINSLIIERKIGKLKNFSAMINYSVNKILQIDFSCPNSKSSEKNDLFYQIIKTIKI